VVAKLRGPGRLPLAKNLVKYDEDRLVKLLGRFGQRVDVRSLRRGLKHSLQRYVGAKRLGPEVKAAIKKRLNNQVRMWLIDQARKNISDYRWQELRDRGAKPGHWLRWIAVSDGGTCASCVKRHNRVEKMKTWQLIGRPGGQQLLCQNRCRCRLIRARKPKGR
jgi:hypothetical protein